MFVLPTVQDSSLQGLRKMGCHEYHCVKIVLGPLCSLINFAARWYCFLQDLFGNHCPFLHLKWLSCNFSLFRPKYWLYTASRLHLWVEYSQEVCRVLAWSLGHGVRHIFFPTTSIQVSYEHTWCHPTPDAVGSHSFVNTFAISVWDAESGNWHSTVALFKVFSVTSFFFFSGSWSRNVD